ncbi:MAG: FHA domain-containing protein [Polyangiales bacterium]
MTCGNCGRQNPSGALYCLDCGQKLRDGASSGGVAAPTAGPFATPQEPPRAFPAACPRCGTAANPSALYCGVCGMPTADMVAPQAPQAPAPQAPPPLAPAPQVQPPQQAPIPQPHAASPAAFAPAAAPPISAVISPAPSARPQVQAHATVMDPPSPRVEARTDNFGAVSAGVVPQIVTILKDGSEGPVYRLTNAQTDLGRYEGTITLPDDPYLSPRHARILRRNDRYYLRDLGSVNGIFQRIREPVEMHHGDVVLVGQQVLRVEVLSDAEVSLGPVMHYGVMLFGTPEQPRLARLVQLTSEGIPRDVYHLYRDETVIGRESGDVVFTDDVFLSRRHVAFRLDRNTRRVTVRDLGSSNGTLVLFRNEREIVDGDIFRIGHHLFRFDAAPRATGGAPLR